MAQLKTKKNDQDVAAFIESLENPLRKQDANTLLAMYQSLYEEQATMWGGAIVGFGQYTSYNAKKQASTWMRSAFSPRKQYMSVYLMAGVSKNPDLLSQLGKYKSGKSCLNIKSLDDIDLNVLQKLIVADINEMNNKYPLD